MGHEIKVNFERNKVASPHRNATLVLFNYPTEKYGPIGLDRIQEAASVGYPYRGHRAEGWDWYVMPTGEQLQGRDAVVEALRAEPTQVELVRDRVLALRSGDIVLDDIEADLAELENVE